MGGRAMERALAKAREKQRREPKPSKFDLALVAAVDRRGELAEAVALAYPEYSRAAVEFGALGKATFDCEPGSAFGYTIRLYRAGAVAPVVEVWVPVEATDAQVTAELQDSFARMGGT